MFLNEHTQTHKTLHNTTIRLPISCLRLFHLTHTSVTCKSVQCVYCFVFSILVFVHIFICFTFVYFFLYSIVFFPLLFVIINISYSLLFLCSFSVSFRSYQCCITFEFVFEAKENIKIRWIIPYNFVIIIIVVVVLVFLFSY